MKSNMSHTIHMRVLKSRGNTGDMSFKRFNPYAQVVSVADLKVGTRYDVFLEAVKSLKPYAETLSGENATPTSMTAVLVEKILQKEFKGCEVGCDLVPSKMKFGHYIAKPWVIFNGEKEINRCKLKYNGVECFYLPRLNKKSSR